MLAWLAARTGLDRFIVFGLLTGLLFAAGGLGFWRGLVAIERLQDKAAKLARDSQDAKWQAEIARANTAAANARADQALASARAESAARDAESRFQEQLKELERNDAALAGGADLVLRRDRVRVLDGARP